jgi:hypothetical protein
MAFKMIEVFFISFCLAFSSGTSLSLNGFQTDKQKHEFVFDLHKFLINPLLANAS